MRNFTQQKVFNVILIKISTNRMTFDYHLNCAYNSAASSIAIQN